MVLLCWHNTQNRKKVYVKLSNVYCNAGRPKKKKNVSCWYEKLLLHAVAFDSHIDTFPHTRIDGTGGHDTAYSRSLASVRERVSTKKKRDINV